MTLPLWLLGLRRRRALRRARPGPLRDLLTTPLPDPRTDWRRTPFLAVDLETTGLDPARDRIVAVGFVAIEQGRIPLASARRLLVRLDDEGVAQSAAVHGITDSAAARLGVPEPEALDLVLRALAGRVLVAHHAPFDRAFLSAACRRHHGAPLVVPTVDTLALEARRWHRREDLPAEGALRLHACRARYGLPPTTPHDALADALATAELLLAQAAHRSRGQLLPLAHLLT